MKNILFIIFSIFLFTTSANSKNLDNALGFMLGGDGGWPNVATYHDINKCVLTYHQPYMGMQLKVKYNFDKAIWNSAEAVDHNGQLFFVLDGQNGLQNVIAVDENGSDVTASLMMFGIAGGDSSQINFPILVDVDRFQVALNDVMKKCKGVKSNYSL